MGWQEPTVTEDFVSFSVKHDIRHLSSHAADHLPLCRPVLVRLAQRREAPKITYDVLCLAKVHLLQQIAHLELHVLDHFANVSNVAGVVLNREVGLDLADHVAGEVERGDGRGCSAEGEDDGGCEFVMCGAGAVLGVEDVDGVPGAGGRRGGCDGCLGEMC